jgi:hypothetical protein
MSTQKEKKENREYGWLILGIVLGGLLSMLIDPWSAYYVRFLDSLNPDAWISFLVGSTVGIVLFMCFMLWLASKLIRTGSFIPNKKKE